MGREGTKQKRVSLFYSYINNIYIFMDLKKKRKGKSCNPCAPQSWATPHNKLKLLGWIAFFDRANKNKKCYLLHGPKIQQQRKKECYY